MTSILGWTISARFFFAKGHYLLPEPVQQARPQGEQHRRRPTGFLAHRSSGDPILAIRSSSSSSDGGNNGSNVCVVVAVNGSGGSGRRRNLGVPGR